jgi:hypothetical protein
MFIELHEETVKYLSASTSHNELKSACHCALKRNDDVVQFCLKSDTDILQTKWLREKIAFAEGKVIQYEGLEDRWHDMNFVPNWDNGQTFRIKPDPKPDVVSYIANSESERVWWKEQSQKWISVPFQIMIVRDGETGALKSVEILK